MLQERLETLSQLLRNPSENIAVVGVTVAIIVVLAVIVSLLLIAFALPSRTELQDDQTDVSTDEHETLARARRSARALTGVTVALGVVAAGLLWYHSTSSVTYCTGSCHAMAEPAEEWRASAHAEVTCMRCHEGRPWISIPRAAVGRTYSLYLEISGAEARVRPVPEAICLDCHRGIRDHEITTFSGETYVHRNDLEDGRSCASCHGRQGHVPALNR